MTNPPLDPIIFGVPGRAREAETSDLLGAILDRLAILEAELGAIAFRVDDIFNLVDEPLTPETLRDRLRALRAFK